MSFVDEFREREMIFGLTEGLADLAGREKLTAYIGFDPTASSLHVGSLLPVMGLVRLQRDGHHAIGVVGGGTGMIGDPSGKSQERTLLTRAQIDANLEGIRGQLERFLDFGGKNPARLVNNADWLEPMSLLDFLRDVGKYFTVNYMVGKESVKRRMDSDDGISFTEFSYMLLQAYDYYELYRRFDCTLQMGGSDQWGNILAGRDLIRKNGGREAHGLVFPLVTSSSGVKFGKTETGTVWLDPERTSPFQFYQFWYKTDDADVIRYLRYFTLLSPAEIAGLQQQLGANASARQAQTVLAEEVTRMVHGETELGRAKRASAVLFGAEIQDLRSGELLDIFADVPSSSVARARFEGAGMPLPELLVELKVATSKAEARRFIAAGGIYVNNKRVSADWETLTAQDAIDGEILIVRRGKKDYHLVRLNGG